MPRAFSEKEREIIRQRLREEGAMLFEAYGLRKTSVEDITRAAGISKGAFYLFYKSKEELFLDILEQLESELRGSILEYSLHPGEDARQNARRILSNFLLMYDACPLLKKFSQSDLDYLLRKLPAERLQAHTHRDRAFFDDFLEKIEREGLTLKVSPRVAFNLVLSLVLFSLHRHDLGEGAYTETMNILIDLVAGYITEGAT
jgi:AcrR family transcriptional regulator